LKRINVIKVIPNIHKLHVRVKVFWIVSESQLEQGKRKTARAKFISNIILNDSVTSI
jgi:hypothetical protein